MAGRERWYLLPSPLPATYEEVLRSVGERSTFGVQRRHLKRLIAARIARDEAEFQLHLAEAEVGLAAKAAYEGGDSWRTIGVVLGISRQAAQQRYGRTTSDQTDSPPER
jgi:hypothetical protein